VDLAQAMPAARFVMIAPPEDRALWESVRNRAARLSNVEIIERVPYHEVQGYFDRTEVFVNTSDFEGFPNSFIQMGQGGGTILSLSVDPDDLLTGYGAGRCAESDWETFLEDARELHVDATVRRALQQRCEQFVAEWHDNNRNVSAFLAGLPAPR
jgi:glycosyltransferase involved in cell wall biosynthesis